MLAVTSDPANPNWGGRSEAISRFEWLGQFECPKPENLCEDEMGSDQMIRVSDKRCFRSCDVDKSDGAISTPTCTPRGTRKEEPVGIGQQRCCENPVGCCIA